MYRQNKTWCICHNNIPTSYPVLACGHKIHPRCMRIWNNSCPLCRENVQIIPHTRCLHNAHSIYDNLDNILTPLREDCLKWKTNPTAQTDALITEIWVQSYLLACFAWKHRNLLRRNDLFIMRLKKRLPNILNNIRRIKNSNWREDKENKKQILKLQYILNRI